jgi:hypothetical protein
MGPSCVIRIAGAMVIAVLAVLSAGESASARVVQTIGSTGPLKLRLPERVALGPGGLIYVLDIGDRASSPVLVKVYAPSGQGLRSWRIATEGGSIPQMLVDPVGNAYVVASSPTANKTSVTYSILKYSPTGQLLATGWGAPAVADGPSDVPAPLAVDGAGHILVSEGGSRIDTFDQAGQLLASWQVAAPGDFKNAISGLTVTTAGTIYIADRKGIARLDSAGNVVARIVPPGDLPGQVAAGTQLIAGPADSLYAVQSQRVQKFGADGQFLGAVGSERHAEWISAAVGADGSIYVPQWRPGGGGEVLKLAPITTVDATRPSITIASFSHPPIKGAPRTHGRLVFARLTYTLSEDAWFRIVLKRRATTKNRRHREFGRYIHKLTLDKAVTAAGTHTLVLDWRSLGYERPFPGDYQLTLVARDDAGNESTPARVKFTAGERPRPAQR